jgi:pilus assembly protein Flp/PilA
MISKLRESVGQFVRDEEGATMVEYILLVALIAVVCITAVTLLGNKANNQMNTAANAMP